MSAKCTPVDRRAILGLVATLILALAAFAALPAPAQDGGEGAGTDGSEPSEETALTDAESRAEAALQAAMNRFTGRPRAAGRGAATVSDAAEEALFDSEAMFLAVIDEHAGTRAAREAVLRVAECQRELGEFESAREGFERAMGLHPTGPLGAASRLGLARCRLELGEAESAIVLCREIVESFPESAEFTDALYWHGAALRTLERYGEARDVWGRLVTGYGGTEAALRAQRESDTLRPVRERLAEWIPEYEAAKSRFLETPRKERAKALGEVRAVLAKFGEAPGAETERFLTAIIEREGGELRAEAVAPLLAAGGPEAAQLLVRELESFDEPTLRAFLGGLERRHLEKVPLRALEPYLASGGKPALQLAAIDCFGRAGTAEAVAALVATIPEAARREELGAAAARAVDRIARQLRRLRDPKAIARLGVVVEQRRDAQLRRVIAADSLGFTRSREAVEPLRAGLFDPAVAVAAASARSVGRLGAEELVPELARLLIERRHELEFLREAVRALGRLGAAGAEEQLLAISGADDVPLRTLAIHALGSIRTESALDRIIEALADPAWQVRSAALEASAGWRRARLVEALVALLERETGALRPAIVERLIELLGVDKGADPRLWREQWEFARKDFIEGERAAAAEEAAREGHTFVRKADPKAARSPTYFGVEIISKRLAFVIDVSGSMSAEVSVPNDDGGTSTMRRIDLAKDELVRALDALQPGTFFTIVKFDQTPVPMAKKLEKLSKKSVAAAKKFVAGLQPAGGTNIFDSLALVLGAGEVDTIYLLSDGAPSAGTYTDPEQILAEITRQNEASRVTIHTIALGFDSDLMRRLAESNQGTYVVAGR